MKGLASFPYQLSICEDVRDTGFDLAAQDQMSLKLNAIFEGSGAGEMARALRGN